MKFVHAILLGLVAADDTSKVWDLASTNSQKDESAFEVWFGNYATDAANARPPYKSNYIQQADSDSSSDSSDSEDEEVQSQADVRFETFPVGLDKSTVYERVVTPRFSQDTDDIFMRSMIKTYAHEEASKVVEHDDAMTAAKEVLSTHKGLSGGALDSYLGTFFDKA